MVSLFVASMVSAPAVLARHGGAGNAHLFRGLRHFFLFHFIFRTFGTVGGIVLIVAIVVGLYLLTTMAARRRGLR